MRNKILPNKDVKKALTGEKPLKPSNKEQRFVHKDKVDRRKKEGWKEVKAMDFEGKTLGVKTHSDDLVLMEK
jgi:hypothetical protein